MPCKLSYTLLVSVLCVGIAWGSSDFPGHKEHNNIGAEGEEFVDWQKDGSLSDVLNDIADDGEWLEQEYNRNCSITLSRNMWLDSQFWLHCN
jgi:hypothetical protein